MSEMDLGAPHADDVVECGPLWVSPDEMCEARAGGEPIPLPPPSLRMLAALLRAQGRVVSRDELQRAATGPRSEGSRAVDVRVLRIRRALGALGRFIVAVPGRGYRIDIVGLSRGG